MYRCRKQPTRPADEYAAGRAARAHEPHESRPQGLACPYETGDKAVERERCHWLRGYYDEFVDCSERRARQRMGLRVFNWVPEPEKKAA